MRKEIYTGKLYVATKWLNLYNAFPSSLYWCHGEETYLLCLEPSIVISGNKFASFYCLQAQQVVWVYLEAMTSRELKEFQV